MINRRNYTILAVTTLVLFAVASVIGDGRDVLWILDDVIFIGFLISAVLLVVMTVAVLVRAVGRSRANS